MYLGNESGNFQILAAASGADPLAGAGTVVLTNDRTVFLLVKYYYRTPEHSLQLCMLYYANYIGMRSEYFLINLNQIAQLL